MVVTDLPNDIDIICLQEVFNEQAWIILNQNLSKAGYNYFLYDPHDQFVKKCSPLFVTFYHTTRISTRWESSERYPPDRTISIALVIFPKVSLI